MESPSVSFERAASFYDRTRSLAPEVLEMLVGLLREELTPGATCLEIGVGTGRFALPLARSGLEMTGLDLSEAMMRRLVETSGGKAPLPLVRGDATRLPFAGASFGGSLAVWVLHLIPDWRAAVDELVRVVKPGGSLVFEIGGWDRAYRLDSMFCVFAGIEPSHLGLNQAQDLDAHLATHGAAPRALGEISDVHETTMEKVISLYEAGTFSFTWRVDEETRLRAGAKLRDWAEIEHGSLDETRKFEWTFRPRAYTKP